MTAHHNFWCDSNSTNVIWIDTTMHRCTPMEDTTAYPLGSFPEPRSEDDNVFRAHVWAVVLAVDALAICAFLLAVWPV